MAEDDVATGTGHTLLGTNSLQGAVDKLDSAVDKLSAAADKMSTSAVRSAQGGTGSGNSGLWNAASNWLRGKSNGGGATFNGQSAGGTADPSSSNGVPSHRAPGPAQTPQYAQVAGNFAQAMANGNGGRGVNGAYNIGSSVAGTKGGLIAAGSVAAVSGLASAANNGASQQDMYNYNMLGGTATRVYNQGIGGVTGPAFTMNGVTGSQNASDFYGGMYTLNAQSGFLQGSSQFNKMQSQAGAMGILDPTSDFSTNVSSMVGLSSNSTDNLMRAFGITTFGNDPTQIARQLLDRLGAPKGKIDPKVIQMLRAPQSGLNTTLNNMVAAGAINPDQAKAIANAAYGLLIAQNKGMSASDFDKLTQTASGNPRDQATRDAQNQLKTMGFATSTAQTMMNNNANQTDSSAMQLDSFAQALYGSTTMLNKFRNMLNSIPGVQQATGANSGAGGGILGKIFGGGAFLGGGGMSLLGGAGMMGFSGLGSLPGLNLLGKGDGAIGLNGGSSLGGGDVMLGGAGVGFSELGALAGSSASGPGFVGVGTGLSSTLGTSTTGGLSGSGDYNPSAGSMGPSSGGNGSPTYGTAQGVPMGRVSPAQAIARIRALMAHHVDIGVGLCQSNAHNIYGIGKGAPSALAAWNAAKYKHPMSDPPPVGAFVFWGGGFGHVAIYAGGGKVYSPGGPGDLSHWVLCSVDAITKGWGKPLLGWTEDNNGVRVVKPATASHKGSANNGSTSGHSTGGHATGGHVPEGRGAGNDYVLDPYTAGGIPGGAASGGMNKSAMIIPGGASVGAVSGGVRRSNGASGGVSQIVFHPGSVVVHFKGDGTSSAATGRALGKAFATEFAQDSRIKALMAGTRG